MGVHVFPILNTLFPLPSLSFPSGSSQCTSPKHPVSCIEPGLLIHFTYDIIHVSIPFFQIIPPSPSPTESKRLFSTSVPLLLSCIQGYRYHFSKFHIYVCLCFLICCLAFLPRSKRLLISWLQSLSAVILEPKEIVCHCFHCFPSVCHEVMGPDAMILVF